MLHKNLGLKLYYFTPNDHLELVEGQQKSVLSRDYQAYIDDEKNRKQKAEDRKKNSQMLEERMK